MSRRWILATLVGLTAPASGCFYLDSINQRPSADIVENQAVYGPPVRGGMAEVSARWSDPDGDAVTFRWAVTACGVGGAGCEAAPYITGTTEVLDFPIPAAFPSDATKPTQSLEVTLDVTDSQGAIARPGQQLVIDVPDAPPAVAIAYDGRQWPDASGKFPVGLPITVRAKKSDPDDPAAAVALTWARPFAPGSDPSKVGWTQLPPVAAQPDVEAYQLVPDVDGPWQIAVTAVDGQGAHTTSTATIAVAADQPPCLGATDPGLAAGTIVVDQTRRFAVLAVADDIDPYPLVGGLGAPGFAWSLASPASGGALVPLGVDGADVVIDPAHYAPGDQLDLRVEISDATARTLPCDASRPTCSIAGDACLQRQTWHLEIR